MLFGSHKKKKCLGGVVTVSGNGSEDSGFESRQFGLLTIAVLFFAI
jgi:hypothetical protein